MGNAFCHIELSLDDTGKAKKFYNSLFDWEITDSRQCLLDDRRRQGHGWRDAEATDAGGAERLGASARALPDLRSKASSRARPRFVCGRSRLTLAPSTMSRGSQSA